MDKAIFKGEDTNTEYSRTFYPDKDGYSIFADSSEFYSTHKDLEKLQTTIDNDPLEKINPLYSKLSKIPGVAICGGMINQLINKSNLLKKSQDVDIFIYGDVDIKKTVDSIISILQPYTYEVDFNDKVIELRVDEDFYKHNKNTHQKVQIVKRLYRSFSEILLGFDVDSSSVGLTVLNDKLDFYYIDRYKFAITYSLNVINPFRQSKSYSYRLYKYVLRGVLPWCVTLTEESKEKYLQCEEDCEHHVSGLIIKILQKPEFLLKEKSDYNIEKVEDITELFNIPIGTFGPPASFIKIIWEKTSDEDLPTSLKANNVYDNWIISQPGTQITSTFNPTDFDYLAPE